MRDFMETMRSSGEPIGGPPPLTPADRNAFASQLDKWLATHIVRQPNTGQPNTGQPNTGQPNTGQPPTGRSK
jgi:hypothetical protein